MKRLLATLACLLTIGTLGVDVAVALPGLDPPDDHSSFEILVRAQEHGVEDNEKTTFQESGGWDFGDRVAYRCAWVELFQGGGELAEVSYKAVSDYPGALEINDRYGVEGDDATSGPHCWGQDDSGSFVHDGSDHFPHGTDLVFYRDGTEIARIDYDLNTCGNLYWTPGDDPGEAWLWWDEDGAADMLDHGDGLCGGGPIEPVAVVQAMARDLAPGIEACATDSMDGDMCRTAGASSDHASRVTLRSAHRMVARGFVHVVDGTAACLQDRVIMIQRRTPNGWQTVDQGRTSDTGRYSERIRGRAGGFRARALEATLADGDTCLPDVSKRRLLGHPR